MTNSLVMANGLVSHENDIYILPGPNDIFSYSDGDAEELYIRGVISSATDLSSCSMELESAQRDWASECHLSARRANLFRGCDFSGIKRVLELGCGCGALTRFLGEQHCQVDAVDGSFRRAEITRLRCRDQDNVCVICADFNALRLPTAHYDLVTLIGVVEYAGMFSDAATTPEEAVVAIIRRALESLAPGGHLVLAIENRLGFKYLAGAGEDHFGRPWVGISNYPPGGDKKILGKQGIRTWDRSQWLAILKRLPGVCCDWFYPFPDYKLPTLLVSGHFLHAYPQAARSVLSRIHSRDYTSFWHPSLDETLFWQTITAAGSVEAFANSFVLVMRRAADTDASPFLCPFDFVHFSGSGRRPEYRVKVWKDRGTRRVHKKRLLSMGDDAPVTPGFLRQVLQEEPFLNGILLSLHWLDRLRAWPTPKTLNDLLQDYYGYIQQQCLQSPARELVDLLPFNIVLAGDGEYHYFDQEWRLDHDIPAAFILFRGLLYFFLENKSVLLPICRENGLKSGSDFLHFALERLLPTDAWSLDGFIELENRMQQAVHDTSLTRPAISEELSREVEEKAPDYQLDQVFLVWGEPGQTTKVTACGEVAGGYQLRFDLPVEFASSPFLQLHLENCGLALEDVLILRRLLIYGVRKNNSRDQITPGSGKDPLSRLMKVDGFMRFSQQWSDCFLVEDEAAQIFHFEMQPLPASEESFLSFECRIVLGIRAMAGTAMRLQQCRFTKQIQETQLLATKEQLVEKQLRLAEIENSRAWKFCLKARMLKNSLLSFLPCRYHQRENGTNDSIVRKESATAAKKKTEPVFTILLTVFNAGAHELELVIESVLRQTMPDWELIIIDCASDHGGTLNALAAVRHDRIRVIHRRIAGNIPRALNQGVEIARAPWVTVLTAFDRMPPDTLSLVQQIIASGDVDLAYGDEQFLDKDGEPQEQWHKSEISSKTIPEDDPVGHSLFVKTSMLEYLGGFNPEFDTNYCFDLVWRARSVGAGIRHIPKILYQRRRFAAMSEAEAQRRR